MEKAIKEVIVNHIKVTLGVKSVEIVKDQSECLVYVDKKERIITNENGDSELNRVPECEGCAPFGRINIKCIVYHTDKKCSLIEYKAFAIYRENIELVNDTINYLLKGMDKHVYAKNGNYGWHGREARKLDVFLKGNSLYSILYFDEQNDRKPLIKPLKGKVATSTINGSKTFYSIQGNTIYKQEIQTGEKDKYGKYRECFNYSGLKTTVFYQDEKEIADVALIDTSYQSGGDKYTPETVLALVVFTDGTKRLICKSGTKEIRTTRYFDGLEILRKAEYSYVKDEGILVYGYTANGDNGHIVVDSVKGEMTDSPKKLIRTPMVEYHKYPRYIEHFEDPNYLPF